jgi:hypothetical protein
MNQAQIEIDHICRWSKVLTTDAYGILLDMVIKKRKILSYYQSPYDGLTAEDIDNMVVDIMNNQ